jgi:hypothetical protein
MMISAGQVTMPSFTPADPEFDARVRASFAQQGACT